MIDLQFCDLERFPNRYVLGKCSRPKSSCDTMVFTTTKDWQLQADRQALAVVKHTNVCGFGQQGLGPRSWQNFRLNSNHSQMAKFCLASPGRDLDITVKRSMRLCF